MKTMLLSSGSLDYQMILLIALATIVTYTFGFVCYSIYLHPLKHIPGPWYCAVSRLPYVLHSLAGDSPQWQHKLHQKYGDMVRYTPNEISVISGETAWQEIYGFRTGAQKGTLAFEKDRNFFFDTQSMVASPEGVHGRQRKVISHAFSDKALRAQEPLLQSYIDLLMQRLTEMNGKPINICEYLNWTTFDIIADLVFGKPFGCLAQAETHKSVGVMLRAIQSVFLYYIQRYMPLFLPFTLFFLGTVSRQDFKDLTVYIAAATEERIARKTDRPDFMTTILAHNTEKVKDGGATKDEIVANARLFMIAGSETTATTLSFATYFLLRHPDCLKKLQKEIRNSFSGVDEVTMDSVLKLDYVMAIIKESLRMRPPVPNGAVRKVPHTGAMVSGRLIPGMASISMTQYAANLSTRNFHAAECFLPERWLDGEEGKSRDVRFRNDNRAVVQPFSFGPRNCIGKNLAYAELRLILTKLVLLFDWHLEPSCEDWDSRCYTATLWVKPELLVRFVPVTASDGLGNGNTGEKKGV